MPCPLNLYDLNYIFRAYWLNSPLNEVVTRNFPAAILTPWCDAPPTEVRSYCLTQLSKASSSKI